MVAIRNANVWAGKGERQYYRLVHDTYATTLGVDGHAREEGTLPAGTVVRLAQATKDSSPWTGAELHNRPPGVPVKVRGAEDLAVELVPAETEVEPIAES